MKRELLALLCLSSFGHVIVLWLFFAMQRVCLQFVIVVLPDHTPYTLHQGMWAVFIMYLNKKIKMSSPLKPMVSEFDPSKAWRQCWDTSFPYVAISETLKYHPLIPMVRIENILTEIITR